MWWNIYIAVKGAWDSRQERLFIPEDITPPGTKDTRAAVQYAAKFYNVNPDIVLCIPTSKKQLS